VPSLQREAKWGTLHANPGRAITADGAPSVCVVLPDSTPVDVPLNGLGERCDKLIAYALSHWHGDFDVKTYELVVQHAGGALTMLRSRDTADVFYAGGIDSVHLRLQGAAGVAASAGPIVDASQCWYAGKMSRRQCEDAVKRGPAGSFLVYKKSSSVFIIYVNVRSVLSKITVKVTDSGYNFGRNIFPTMAATVAAARGYEIQGRSGKYEVMLTWPGGGGEPFPHDERRFTKRRDPAKSALSPYPRVPKHDRRSFKNVPVQDGYELVEEDAISEDGEGAEGSEYGLLGDVQLPPESIEHPYEVLSPLLKFQKPKKDDKNKAGPRRASAPESTQGEGAPSPYESPEVLAAEEANAEGWGNQIDASIGATEARLHQLQQLREMELSPNQPLHETLPVHRRMREARVPRRATTDSDLWPSDGSQDATPEPPPRLSRATHLEEHPYEMPGVLRVATKAKVVLSKDSEDRERARSAPVPNASMEALRKIPPKVKTRKKGKGKPPVPQANVDTVATSPPPDACPPSPEADVIYDFATAMTPVSGGQTPTSGGRTPDQPDYAVPSKIAAMPLPSEELLVHMLAAPTLKAKKKKSKNAPPRSPSDNGDDEGTYAAATTVMSPIKRTPPQSICSPSNTHLSSSCADTGLSSPIAEERPVWGSPSASEESTPSRRASTDGPPVAARRVQVDREPASRSQMKPSVVARPDHQRDIGSAAPAVGGDDAAAQTEDTPWRYIEMDDGRVYYVNTRTGKTSWTLPDNL